MVGRAFEERGYKERRAHRYIGRKPVKTGEEYDVTIEGVGTRGDAFARIQNFIIFVPGAKEGDSLRVRITSVHEKFATAEIVGAGKPEEAEETEEAGTEAKAEEKTEEKAEEEAEAGAEEEAEGNEL